MALEEPEQTTTGSDDDKQDAWDEAWAQDTSPKEDIASETADDPWAEVTAPDTSVSLTLEKGAAAAAVQEAVQTSASKATTEAAAAEPEADELALETLPIVAARPSAAPMVAPPSPVIEREAEPVGEGRPSSAALRPLSLAETWAAAQAKPKVPMRIIATGIIGAGVLVASTCIWSAWDAWSAPSLTPPSLESVMANIPTAPQRDAWLKDVLAAKQQVPQSWDPALPALAPSRKQAAGPAPRASASPRVATAKVSAPQAKTTAQPPASSPPQGDNFYGSIFGSAARYQAASGNPSSRGEAEPATPTQAPSVEGIVVRARLQDDVSSDPAGAPVIAVLARKAKVGTALLPPGTELHGRVTGSNDTRVFVAFQFARTPDDHRIELQGSARDEGGRAGIPGKKLITQHTAGSIGVASASKAVQEAGREFAGTLGSILGAGLEGATDASADKAKRADRDEYVVIAPRGALFAIYVQSVGA